MPIDEAATAPRRYRRNAHHFGYGTCPLCGRHGVRLITDHCHRHGWIRGRICESCNQALWHEERRTTLIDFARGRCWHRHRTPEATERCRERDRHANRVHLEHYLRCPDCAREVEESR